MNIPSLSFIYQEASKTIRRFPLALLSATIASFCAVWLIEVEYSELQHYEFLYRVIMSSVLGISLFAVITLIAEKLKIATFGLWGARLACSFLLASYYLMLPDNIFDGIEKHLIRYALFFLAAHLLVAFGPFWKSQEFNGFWQYNKTLFLRFLTAVLFSTVLFIGLSIALLAIDNLFRVDLPDEWFSQLWFLIVGIFNTWFFLSGVPDDLSALETKQKYPNGLKILTQYILIPLVIIYLVILYLYAAKIIVEWQWPEGWVAILVLSFSIAGIFSLLLLHPIQERVENQWIKSFSRYYYVSLGPLIVMLLLAIWRRISEYGITENRYFVLILGFWLALMAGYFIMSRTKSIKVIPSSLFLIAVLASFGPWGAFSVSESSQVDRLETLLLKNNLLVDERVHRAKHSVPDEDTQEISSIVRYLSERHGLQSIQPWFKQNLDSLTLHAGDSTQRNIRYHQPQAVVELMGIEYMGRGDLSATHRYFSAKPQETLPLDGYQWMIENQNLHTGQDSVTVSVESQSLLIKLNSDSMQVSVGSPQANQNSITLNLRLLMEELNQLSGQERYNVPQAQMSLEKQNDWLRVRLNLKTLNIRREGNEWLADNIQADILISLK